MKQMKVCILLVIILFISGILYHLSQNNVEHYVCQPIYVGYNQPCDLIGCKSICEPNKYECSLSTTKCEYRVPQPSGMPCKTNIECNSEYCIFDANGKNTGIGYCG